MDSNMSTISASKSLVALALFPCDPEVAYEPRDNGQAEKDKNLGWMRAMTDEQIREEERYNVSTNLTLYTLGSDPWTIKKKLCKTSLGHLNRLSLNANIVTTEIIAYLPQDDKKIIEQGSGLAVEVYDNDTASIHKLVLKTWQGGGSYLLANGWRKEFVVRRGLKTGDVVGMFWDRNLSKIRFCVLSRAPMEASSASVVTGSASCARYRA
ncbi:hypothetical protein CARUB_v10024960mg, partial [Capsella rubella]